MRDTRARDSIPNLVGKLFRQSARVHNRALTRFEISAVQANILAVLWLEGPLTAGELQASLALGSSTLTGTIDRMEKAGLVSREAVQGDRRAVRLVPAKWPARKREALFARLAETEDACLAELTEKERAELRRLLDKAVQSMARVDDGDE